jgi:archaellum component FlaC
MGMPIDFRESFIGSTIAAMARKKKVVRGVTNEKIMGFLVEMDNHITTMDGRITNMDDRITNIDGRITTMDGRITNTNDRVTDMDRRMATKEDLKDFATKADLERFKEDILEEIRPITKAVDKDAVTLVNHEKRIISLERKTAVK